LIAKPLTMMHADLHAHPWQQRPRQCQLDIWSQLFRISASDLHHAWVQHHGCYEPMVEERCDMNRDEVEGKVEQAKGKLKKAAGELTDDPDLQDEGAADEAEGDAQEQFGRGKRKVGETVENIGKAIKR
jgi:uncharacterized protein YjbJ (UPF0337 family)